MPTSAKKPQVIILCEDLTHYHFARKFLQLKGFTKFIPVVAPKGQVSGEQFVRDRFPIEVGAIRTKSYLNCMLLAITDADVQSIKARTQTLHDALAKSRQAEIKSHEKVLIIIPARNIESWFHFLETGSCDEVLDVKVRYRNAKPTFYAGRLVAFCNQNPGPACPSSLTRACEAWNSLGPSCDS